jgi:hypothetical protein
MQGASGNRCERTSQLVVRRFFEDALDVHDGRSVDRLDRADGHDILVDRQHFCAMKA